MQRWERDATEAVIELAETAPAGADRSHQLVGTVFERIFGQGAALRAQLAVLAAATDPVVAPVLRRVIERRVGYLVTAPAVDGKANDAVRRVLAAALGLRRGQLAIVTGQRGRDKIMLVVDPPAGLAARIDALTGEM